VAVAPPAFLLNLLPFPGRLSFARWGPRKRYLNARQFATALPPFLPRIGDLRLTGAVSIANITPVSACNHRHGADTTDTHTVGGGRIPSRGRLMGSGSAAVGRSTGVPMGPIGPGERRMVRMGARPLSVVQVCPLAYLLAGYLRLFCGKRACSSLKTTPGVSQS
jgi:hypothetical protein